MGGPPGSSRRPASAQDHHQLSCYADGGATGINELPDGMRHIPHHPHSHHPHRSLSSSMMRERERMLAEEAQQQARMVSRSRDFPTGLIPNRTSGSDPGTDSLRPTLLLGGITLFSTSPLANTFSQVLRQPSYVLGQSGSPSMMPAVGESIHQYHQSRVQFSIASNPSSACSPPSSSPLAINPLASNVFSYVERFTHQRLPHDTHSPAIPNEIQYWAGVIMRNACRKDETRGGIRQCANMQCGKWESVPREFAKCRRCRKAKYCSKNCQSRAWQHGHRFWCSTRAEGEGSSTSNGNIASGEGIEATNPVINEIAHREGELDGTTRVTDRASRALVDAAIERLRRDPSIGDPTAAAGVRNIPREVSEVNSNIATPPDRETRVRNPINLVNTAGAGNGHLQEPGHDHHLVHQDGTMILGRGAVVGRPDGVVVNGMEDLVDERDQIRLMVEDQEGGRVINP